MIKAGHGSVFGDPLNRDPNHNAGVSRLAYEYVPYDGPIVEREFAKEKGLDRFFTGIPCRNGHLSEREMPLTRSRCIACHRIGLNRTYQRVKKERVAYSLKYASENREAVRDYKKSYYLKNKEEIIASTKERVSNNRQLYTAIWRASKQRRRRADGRYNAQDIIRIGDLQKWKCVNCKKCIKDEYHVDHIEPLNKGGSNWPSNLQLLCPKCNISKSDKNPIDWAQENGRLL